MNTPPIELQPIFFCSPSRILFGAGVRHALPELLEKMGLRRCLIVTDRYFSSPGGAANLIKDAINAQGLNCEVFDGGEPDPSLSLCDAATSELASRPQPDCVIAVGGGSNIDLAKALALTLVSQQSASAYVGISRLPHAPLPIIAIPTTAGTASEITPGAILSAGNGKTKVAIMDNELRARVAVIDPELTLTCPPRVTADAGVDALTHAIESYITQDALDFDRAGQADPGYSGRNVLTRLFAREAIRLCFEHLEVAYREPLNLRARTGMALASLCAGLSYGNAGLNGVHALAYGVAALTHETHGTTNAVMLPYVMANLASERTEDLCDIARLAGVHSPVGVCPQAAFSAARHVRALIASVGVATDLRSLGISEAQLSDIAQAGFGVHRLTKAFPAPDALARYQAIVAAAHAGSLP